ncbi:MAG: dockerin type I repeat-containing protein [Oscillospiraceae bacterium]|nr:dockerin type I repeat-containing protein [Oscillospiraceae bacterium]
MIRNQLAAAVCAVCMTVFAMNYIQTFRASAENENSAENDKISIAIDQKTLTLDELQECDYTIPVFVRLDQNISINTAEMMIQVDSACDFEPVTSPTLCYEMTENFLMMEMISSSKFDDNSIRFLWASANSIEETGSLVLLMVHVPEDVQGGEKFAISYLPEVTHQGHTFEHIWGKIGLESMDYAKKGQVTWTDGWIEIAPESVPATLPGDVNLDGAVDIIDVVLMNRVYVGVEKIGAEAKANGDIDGDGKISLADSMNVLRYLVHLIDDLKNIN